MKRNCLIYQQNVPEIALLSLEDVCDEVLRLLQAFSVPFDFCYGLKNRLWEGKKSSTTDCSFSHRWNYAFAVVSLAT